MRLGFVQTFALFVAIGLWCDPALADDRLAALKVGRVAPGTVAAPFELTSLDGAAVDLAQLKGKVVVVNFWATWCGPCKRAVPHNNEMLRKYAAKGVLLIGACGGGGEENMGAVAQATGLAYPTARTTKATTEAWRVQWWPTYAVIDRKGTLRALGLRPDAVEPLVDALLFEQPN